MTGSPDVLVGAALQENYLGFQIRPSLTDLAEVLGKVRDNLPEYKVWPVSVR